MRRIFGSVLVFFSSITLYAQKEDSIFIKRVSDEILTNGKAYDNLRHLTKQIGARLAGSPGMVKAEQWGLKVMQESGADKAWMQECMVPHWVRGGKDEAKIVPSNSKVWETFLDVVALGNSIGTDKKWIKAEVIEVKSFEDLDAKKD